MKSAKIFRKALSLIDGFTFESDLPDVPDNVLLPLAATQASDVTPEDVQSNIVNQVNVAFLFCVRGEDVYRRVRGDGAFYHLILADWNSEHSAAPFPPDRIEQLITIFVIARRRYLVSDSTEVKTKLTSSVDRFISIIDEVDASSAPRRPPGLKVPKGFKPSLVWPPAHFGPLDVAIMAESTIRKELFGFDHKNKGDEEDAPLFPHDQDLPLVVRKFLCHLSLTETVPDSKAALFPAPVAFNTNEQRQEWYLPTGHKSRFYATVGEFITYAHAQFRNDEFGPKHHVIGLFTPWFFEVDAVEAKAAEKDEPIPVAWQKTCFRAGMMICLSEFKRDGIDWTYRLIMFKPSRPHYIRAEEPSDRRPKQDAWIEELLKLLKSDFDIVQGWIGGKARAHRDAPSGRRVSPDSVEVSCEIMAEIMEDPSSLPTTRTGLIKRGFEEMDQFMGS
ncbi:hypothetical protein F5Y05DRAFT_420707 [Hypoxylon sp. FL0543]|nr:hypothetical protein F5Y05DRAFT_420707 [Hypoxylon sp. FL0543]